MKTVVFFISLLIPIALLTWGCGNSGSEDCPEPEVDTVYLDDDFKDGRIDQSGQNQQAGNSVVAIIDPTTRDYTILYNHLVKKLSDGSPVVYFAVRRKRAAYGFVRAGIDASGNFRSEAFETEYNNGKISLVAHEQLFWLVDCWAPTCFGCSPNSNGTDCDCPGELSLNDEEFIIEWIDDDTGFWDNDLNDTNIECNFGSAGGGLYPTQVFYKN